MFAINVRAPFFLMQDALKVMKREAIEGSIINIISMSGHGGQSFITAYCASKGALITLTKNVAYSVMNHRIRVNGLTIGWMDTPGEDRIMKTYHGAEDGWLDEAEKGRPFGRLLKPDEVARAVAFLASARERADDRLDHRLRPAGARRRRCAGRRRRLASLALRRRGVPAIATASVMASAMVAAIERKPSKFASTISSSTSAGEAIGENTESVIDTILAPAAWRHWSAPLSRWHRA